MSSNLETLVPFLRGLRARGPGRREQTPVIPRPQPPREAARSYVAALRLLFVPMARAVASKVLPRIGEIAARSDGVRLDTDDEDRARSIVRAARLVFDFPENMVENAAQNALRKASNHGEEELRRQFRIVNVDPIGSEQGVEPKIREAVRENVRLIKSIPEDYFDRLEDEMVESVRVGRSTEDIARRIRERFMSSDDDEGALAMAERKAEFIARDQVAKMNGDLTEIRHNNLGIIKYRWATAQDERVRGNPFGRYPNARPSHYDREGQIFSYDDPPEGGHPGADYGCRCLAIPVLDDILGEGADLTGGAAPSFSFDPLAFLRR